MSKPKLVIMAAGLGSRYGGLKQMEAVTEAGEIILDFAVYDAMKAGFEDVIFVIKPEMEEIFREKYMAPMSKYINCHCVFQTIDQLPEGYAVPEGRVKPWGTCHAVMAASHIIDGPFAVINADDYYGRDAFKKVYDFLASDQDDYTYCMAGYYVENTLSDQGAVTRGVCVTDADSNLVSIRETKEIGWAGDLIVYPGTTADADCKCCCTSASGCCGDAASDSNDEPETCMCEIERGTVVSMNFWGFKNSMMNEMIQGFPEFLDKAIAENPMKEEYLLPVKIGEMLEADQVKVKVLEASDKWYGVTYKEDKEVVVEAFKKMKADGKYPEKLWV